MLPTDSFGQKENFQIVFFIIFAFALFPFLPDRYLGPFNAINPHLIGKLAIALVLVSAMGHLSVRYIGVRYGLPFAGLLGGFASSTATTAAMGNMAKNEPSSVQVAADAALLSSLATFLQLAFIVGITSSKTLLAMAFPLLCGGASLLMYIWLLSIHTHRIPLPENSKISQAFSLKSAAVVILSLVIILIIAAALEDWAGEAGLISTAAFSGFADAHVAAASVSAMVARERITVEAAILPILMGFSSNTMTKALMAIATGGKEFALRVLPGLAVMLIALWVAVLLGR